MQLESGVTLRQDVAKYQLMNEICLFTSRPFKSYHQPLDSLLTAPAKLLKFLFYFWAAGRASRNADRTNLELEIFSQAFTPETFPLLLRWNHLSCLLWTQRKPTNLRQIWIFRRIVVSDGCIWSQQTGCFPSQIHFLVTTTGRCNPPASLLLLKMSKLHFYPMQRMFAGFTSDYRTLWICAQTTQKIRLIPVLIVNVWCITEQTNSWKVKRAGVISMLLWSGKDNWWWDIESRNPCTKLCVCVCVWESVDEWVLCSVRRVWSSLTHTHRQPYMNLPSVVRRWEDVMSSIWLLSLINKTHTR